MWLCFSKKTDDYVVATGKQYSVKYFINLVCKILDIDIAWKGKMFKRNSHKIKNKNNNKM